MNVEFNFGIIQINIRLFAHFVDEIQKTKISFIRSQKKRTLITPTIKGIKSILFFKNKMKCVTDKIIIGWNHKYFFLCMMCSFHSFHRCECRKITFLVSNYLTVSPWLLYFKWCFFFLEVILKQQIKLAIISQLNYTDYTYFIVSVILLIICYKVLLVINQDSYTHKFESSKSS